MKHGLRSTAIFLAIAGFASVASAQEMAVRGAAATGAANGTVTVSASPLHALGPDGISIVAFELTGGSGTWSLPPANDGGESGDAVADDGVWSLSADLPNLSPGDYALVVYVVGTDGSEFVSSPFDVTLN